MAQVRDALSARARVLGPAAVSLSALIGIVLFPGATAVSSARVAIVTAATAVLVQRSARGHSGDQRVWTWFAWAGFALSTGAVADLLVRVVIGTSAAAPYLFPAGVLVSCLLTYQGLILWNRSRTAIADPGDVLNGLSATLTVAALGNLALIGLHGDWLENPAGPSSWLSVQLHLLCLGAGVVLVGTGAFFVQSGSVARDWRTWRGVAVLLLAVVGTAVSPCTGLLPESLAWSQSVAGENVFTVAWVLPISVMALNALAPPRVATPQPASATEVNQGALTVLLAALAVLLLSSRLDPGLTGAAVVLAGLAILGAGARSVHLVRDLTNLAVRRQEALTDELTGLANRRAFTRELAERTRAGRQASLLVIDLNDFKDINDGLGHATGDQVLVATAELLRQGTPAGGLTARLGGDEFAVLLPGTVTADAVAVAWRLAEAGERRSVAVPVGLSIGVASREATFGTDRLIDGEELLRRADAAMYVAKTTRAQVSVYDQDLDRLRRDQNQLTHDLLDAFEGDHGLPFEVYYQPQVSMHTGQVAGVEALVRWQHPERGLLAPGQFLELVERNGRMRELTQFVVWSALRDAAVWERTGLKPLRVSVNLSPSCLTDPVFPLMLDQIVQAGVEPGVITFEVTETSLMKDPEHSLRICALIVQAGFGLSIDDYGTGYSSLAYLSDLPATELKIDRAFVSRIQSDARVRAIVSGTVDLAHQLGLRIVAEGAEQSGTLGLLRDLGCDEVQGYVYSPPLPAVQLYAWVLNQETARGFTDDEVVRT
ncbi:GGDEF-domain containing protein [Kineosporia sp. NBRC 101677]|uniref:putative bifunctional diguanylate cyclase/phosphodiesterase n=1 Tax=Kineosporia sp. NBRC 101677 TaxID=3032197 RepID=UPI0024A5D722|nr:bifunctional diguanylate cyclase/phosphodiesterase [Kineosporia sp. NBRC 101677]GLY15862.1 GGDEF-domain containing protein [Kineosporia sp. NBRC 101677]